MPAGSNRALVVAVAPGCHFCNDSIPFYKNLIDQRNQKNSGVKFIAAVPTNEKPEEAQKLVSEETQKFSAGGAQPDAMVNLDFAAIKVPGTPTLMLVDNTGKVLDVWVGKLDSKGEKAGAEDAVGTALFRAPSPRGALPFESSPPGPLSTPWRGGC